jgi:hypothetical protein
MVNTLALAVVLAGVSISLGQQTGAPAQKAPRAEEEEKGTPPKRKIRVEEEDTPKSKAPARPSQLEQLLTQALKNNPDIRVAEARAATAEAELNRARLQVTREVIRLHNALLSQKASVGHQTKKYERMKQLQEQNSVPPQIVDEAQDALTAAKGKLAELETQLNALLGKAAGAEVSDPNIRQRAVEALARFQNANQISAAETAFRRVYEQHKPAGPMADRIRKELEKPVSVKVSEVFLSEVLQNLEDRASVTIKLMPDGLPQPKLTMQLTDVSMAAVLQCIEDSEPGYRFVVREYGILFAPEAKLPPGAVSVQDFLRKPAESRAKGPNDYTWSGLPWTPPDNAEGTVTKVDGRGIITIKLQSSEPGLLAGHVLRLYRPGDKSSPAKLLGDVRIVSLQNQEAVAQPIGRLVEAPKLGDKVVSRLEPQPPASSEKPAESVEGVVKAVNAGGLMTISIGSDDGLAKGQTLELYWKPHRPPIEDARGFGKVRVVEVEAHQAVVQSVDRPTRVLQLGDRIIGHIVKK